MIHRYNWSQFLQDELCNHDPQYVMKSAYEAAKRHLVLLFADSSSLRLSADVKIHLSIVINAMSKIIKTTLILTRAHCLGALRVYTSSLIRYVYTQYEMNMRHQRRTDKISRTTTAFHHNRKLSVRKIEKRKD